MDIPAENLHTPKVAAVQVIIFDGRVVARGCSEQTMGARRPVFAGQIPLFSQTTDRRRPVFRGQDDLLSGGGQFTCLGLSIGNVVPWWRR
jgi:hypothetical protein